MVHAQWLEGDFWETAIKSSDCSPQQQRKMGLSAETVEGLTVTGIYFRVL